MMYYYPWFGSCKNCSNNCTSCYENNGSCNACRLGYEPNPLNSMDCQFIAIAMNNTNITQVINQSSNNT